MPKHFKKLQERVPGVMDALKEVSEQARKAGPLDEKSAHLIQLAAAAAMRSEGAVHSHVRRALREGVSPDEIRHALVLLIPTMGFPAVSAAMCWAEDILDD